MYKHSILGFTLIELLVVIAVVGVLAAGVFTAINPLEQLARARDADRKVKLGQLAQALQTYFTSKIQFPAVNNSWITTLKNEGELKNVPAQSTYVAVTDICTSSLPSRGKESDYCYLSNGQDAAVYVRMESSAENKKCSSNIPRAWFMWLSTEGTGRIMCTGTTSEPTGL